MSFVSLESEECSTPGEDPHSSPTTGEETNQDVHYLTDRNFSAPSSSTPVRDATPTNHVLAVEGGGQEGVRLEGQLVEEEEEDDQGDSSKEVNAEEKEERERTAKGSLVASSEC